jgi:hypothetical protein
MPWLSRDPAFFLYSAGKKAGASNFSCGQIGEGVFPSQCIALALPVLIVVAGCGRKPLPASLAPPRDRAVLERRFEALQTGIPEPEIAAFMGKPGTVLAGYSTHVLQRKPEGEGQIMGPGESEKCWASDDKTDAVRVVFGSDVKARLIELLEIKPMDSRPPMQNGSKGR